MKRILQQLTALALFAAGAHAASPGFSGLNPNGGQRGTEVEVTFSGARLGDAKGVLCYTPGIEIGDVKVVNDGNFTAKVKIPADCPLGEHAMRLWTATGLTEVKTFWVGPYPVVESKASANKDPKATALNITPENAQPIALNTTVTGVIKIEQTEYFSVELKKGERMNIDVTGLRLATVASAGTNAIFDPTVIVTRANGEILARCDDNLPGRYDPIVSFVAPEDGKFIVSIRDGQYAGGGNKYRMSIGTFPMPQIVYPLGGKAGDEVELTMLGDAAGTFTQKAKLSQIDANKSALENPFRLVAEKDGLVAPEPTPFRMSNFPNVMEVEPNHDIAHATATELPLPLALNGIIANKGDEDFFKFKATKGQSLDVTVWARRLRSPLDSVITLYNEKGSQIATNDDSGNPDSYLRFNVPADGSYYLGVRDHMRRGGPLFAYRVEITPAAPAVALNFPQYGVNTYQLYQTMTVPRGNRFATYLKVKRSDFNDETVPSFPDLPAGVTAHVVPVPTNTDVVPVVFEATADAPVAAKLCSVAVETTKPENKLRGELEHGVDLLVGNNATAFYKVHVNKAAVSVADEAPFSVNLVAPKNPVLQGGSTNLKVVAERKGDFKGAINLSMVWTPPQIGSQAQVTIPPDQTEALMPINANGDAKLTKWNLAVVANADTGKGVVKTSSDFVEIEVAQPFVTGKIEMNSIEQGQSGELVCKLTQVRPFEGKAKVKLQGLPNKAAAEDVEITSKDEEIHFHVATEKTTPAGQHKGLFCQITVPQNGEELLSNTAQGGILRIDPIEKPAEKGPAKKPEIKVVEKK
jgi:pre-peptidase